MYWVVIFIAFACLLGFYWQSIMQHCRKALRERVRCDECGKKIPASYYPYNPTMCLCNYPRVVCA